MAGPSRSSDDDLIANINVTPFVDVVLVLLVIFMVTAPAIYQSTIPVTLSKAASGEKKTSQTQPIDLTLTQDGKLFWAKNLITWEDLATRLVQMKETLTRETASISADQATPHGTVVRLMDVLREHGLTRFSLNVESQRSE